MKENRIFHRSKEGSEVIDEVAWQTTDRDERINEKKIDGTGLSVIRCAGGMMKKRRQDVEGAR